ncbi:hypothetical protein [Streptomyces sp. NPDC102282]|uniref:hypothetical protein n=1 Tax=Streptomyces sp. NPDC102282 TaxID=3366154 RepID=UPI00382982C6
MLVLAVFAGVLSLLRWGRANQVAGVVSALVGVGTLGTGVGALLAPSETTLVHVTRTGGASATGGGDANRGAVVSSSAGAVSIRKIGASQADSGSASTGYQRQE